MTMTTDGWTTDTQWWPMGRWTIKVCFQKS